MSESIFFGDEGNCKARGRLSEGKLAGAERLLKNFVENQERISTLTSTKNAR
jgi:hypothetical protein